MPAEESEMARTSRKVAMHTPSAEPISSEAIAALVGVLRRRSPRVHSLTNIVAQNFTANVLLATGSIPSMTIAPDEVAAFTARSDALNINIGTLDATLRKSIPRAIASARKNRKPWAFDPVLIDRSPPRLKFARSILASGPTILRANRTEFGALAGVDADEAAIAAFAEKHGCVVAITGEVDLVADATRVVRLANGHPLMGQVTAVGCAATALIAAFAAVEDDALLATVAGLAMISIAGELAGETAKGPGSFSVALLDALHALDAGSLAHRLRLTP
jgi:hydroxyethylthiazole kinase